MIKRPKPGEDEEDILRMQEEFLKEKSKNVNLKPAAQFVNLRPAEPTKRPNTAETGIRKPSKYAQSKGLKNNDSKRARSEPFVVESTSSVLGDILEKNVDEPITDDVLEKDMEEMQESETQDDDDKVYFPKLIPSVLGNIIEKNFDDYIDFEFKPMPSEGFPKVAKCGSNFVTSKNICGQNKQKKFSVMDIVEPSCFGTEKSITSQQMNLPQKSYMLSSKEANDIHNENIKVLKNMSEKEILDEQQKLLTNLDPKLIQFIKSRRNQAQSTENVTRHSNPKQIVEEKMDTEAVPLENNDDSLWENDVLSHPDVNMWLHFDSLEKDKLEWMKGIEESKKLKPDEPYEARFDFKGYLLPYSMEYTEKSKTLFHHGDEPHRPGYSITELIELSRSAVTQQRVMALNSLAGILEYYSAGTYKDIIEIPLSKIFFIIRIAIDENKMIILEPALKAMRNLLYNRIDEASLDALVGFEGGIQQPCLENDKSEIEELQSQESEFKDYHLAEIDIISALLRTDILQRLYYILETIRPSYNCVQYALQILVRLARDSVITAHKIVEMDHIMKTIINHFIPNTSINFAFDPQIVYNGKPVLAAIKLMRILSLQSVEIGNCLETKYDILNPICQYISSGVDRTYGLRIQIEAYYLLFNLLQYGVGTKVALSLSPVIITTLYKHVQGTDMFIESSILSATHAAVVLQTVNIILCCNFNTADNFKSQVYPLLKEGFQKWFSQLSNANNYTCGHLRLLSAIIDCTKTILLLENVPMKFLVHSLTQFSSSQGFDCLVKHLIPSSNLLSGLDTKDLHLVSNLVSLGSSVIDSAQKVLPILNILSPLPFFASLSKLLICVNDNSLSEAYLNSFSMYLLQISKIVPSLCDNWFTRMETDFVFNILKLASQINTLETNKDVLYAVANKLCYILRIDKNIELEYLFNHIVFNKNWFTAERLMNLINLSDADGFSKALTSIDEIKVCYGKVINLNYEDTGPNVVLRKWQEPILPRDWIYLPILSLYSKSQEIEIRPMNYGEQPKKISKRAAIEKEFIIRCSLEWVLFNELCFSDILDDIDVTDRFCRIMCVFLCDNSLFLDAKIKLLLQKCTQVLFNKKAAFNFDKDLVGLHNFQDFYTQFLEQFQSVSYGDHIFAACVLVPLAQKHNVKWRKLLWSEYAGCLRILDCPEEMLCYNINEYLNPEETEESLIKSYFQALSSNLLRPGTVAHKIAQHHVNMFKNRANSVNN